MTIDNTLTEEIREMTKTRDDHEAAIRFTMSILRRAKDWQEGQHALTDEDRFAHLFNGDDDIEIAQNIIREAEERLGNALPY
jgi:hypothetical protein